MAHEWEMVDGTQNESPGTGIPVPQVCILKKQELRLYVILKLEYLHWLPHTHVQQVKQ